MSKDIKKIPEIPEVCPEFYPEAFQEELLNNGCFCVTLDPYLLNQHLSDDSGINIFYYNLSKSHPTLFSNTSVYLSKKHFLLMSELIDTIHQTLNKLPIRQQLFPLHSLEKLNSLANGPMGVFMGYDFHLGIDGPKLIEINTNAGGGLLNLELAKAQKKCAQLNFAEQEQLLPLDQMEDKFFSHFINDWESQKGNLPLRTIAIIDDHPMSQFLFPEFQLFQHLFEKHNIKCHILDPSQLKIIGDKVYYGEDIIDLIYNRLTDFYLEEVQHQLLKEAFDKNLVVLTPSPYHYHLYAHKDNLVHLSNEKFLAEMDVRAVQIEILNRGIPKSRMLVNQLSENFWRDRRSYFFKPNSGYGSKAAYRGDKITKKVWETIINGKYIAQEIVPPSHRHILVDGEKKEMKCDFRAYVYNGKIQLLAARLYEGQTTNFRTPGGGFAPVFVL